jgi:hypothetical protein
MNFCITAHKITNEMWYIDWEHYSSIEIDCLYRTLNEIVCFMFLQIVFNCNTVFY